jgi:hypothetical protein
LEPWRGIPLAVYTVHIVRHVNGAETMSHMQRVAVTSSALSSVGFDGREGVLEVEFRTGRVYRYVGVPSRKHAELMEAESLGQYFGREIRNAGYPCERLK